MVGKRAGVGCLGAGAGGGGTSVARSGASVDRERAEMSGREHREARTAQWMSTLERQQDTEGSSNLGIGTVPWRHTTAYAWLGQLDVMWSDRDMNSEVGGLCRWRTVIDSCDHPSSTDVFER